MSSPSSVEIVPARLPETSRETTKEAFREILQVRNSAEGILSNEGNNARGGRKPEETSGPNFLLRRRIEKSAPLRRSP